MNTENFPLEQLSLFKDDGDFFGLLNLGDVVMRWDGLGPCKFLCHISTTWATWKWRKVLQAMSMVFLHPFVYWFMQCTVGCNSETFLSVPVGWRLVWMGFSVFFSLLSHVMIWGMLILADFHVVVEPGMIEVALSMKHLTMNMPRFSTEFPPPTPQFIQLPCFFWVLVLIHLQLPPRVRSMFLFVVYVPLQFAFGAVQLVSYLEASMPSFFFLFFKNMCVYIYIFTYTYIHDLLKQSQLLHRQVGHLSVESYLGYDRLIFSEA